MDLEKENKYIEDFISNLSDEEFIEMLEECGYNATEENSCSNLLFIDTQEILNKLYSIIIELDARENTNNCVVVGLLDKGWTELCEEAIELLEQIK